MPKIDRVRIQFADGETYTYTVGKGVTSIIPLLGMSYPGVRVVHDDGQFYEYFGVPYVLFYTQ